MPWRAASRPTAATGLTSPVLPGTCVMAMSFVRRTDRALERGEVELAGGVAVDHVDLDADARLQLEKCEIVRQVLGARRDERDRPHGTEPRRRPCPSRAWRFSTTAISSGRAPISAATAS